MCMNKLKIVDWKTAFLLVLVISASLIAISGLFVGIWWVTMTCWNSFMPLIWSTAPHITLPQAAAGTILLAFLASNIKISISIGKDKEKD